MMSRCVVELATGEGKTLATVIPAVLFALAGKKVWIATANDYLARRDAEWMRPVYEDAGLTVESLASPSEREQRAQAYRANVTYGTIRDFGFDDLRRRLDRRHESSNAADHRDEPSPRCDVLIVDEADSVLIDEASTPLIINSRTESLDVSTQACYRWCAKVASEFRAGDYVPSPSENGVALTMAGRRRFLRFTMPREMASLTTTTILHALERAIWANLTIHRDTHYVIQGEHVALVDEFTGRVSEGRTLGGGRHQAIEAREGLPLTPESNPVARITIQEFAAMFQHLCGITATAWEDRHELADVYGLDVRRVASFEPSRRRLENTIVANDRAQKWQLIADEIERMVSVDRPVLIGTRTVRHSEQLSAVLEERDIPHVVLNARNPTEEAVTVAQAGQPGRVTVATNMAGRGTDIRLDPRAAQAGGLHVIVSELHAAARIDRQLIGRAARQGDPGSARLFLCLDDEILDAAMGEAKTGRIRGRYGDARQARAKIERLLAQSQRSLARQRRTERKQLTEFESKLAESLASIGLDPHLDPLPT